MPKVRRVQSSEGRPAFDVEAFLESAGAAQRVVSYSKGQTVFSQGQPSDAVMYIQKGGIKISVLSRTGKEAVVAMLGRGDFFGEGALTGQSIRIGTATATMLTTILVIGKEAMLRRLHDEHPTITQQIGAALGRLESGEVGGEDSPWPINRARDDLQRLIGAVPHGHWKTTTFLAGLRTIRHKPILPSVPQAIIPRNENTPCSASATRGAIPAGTIVLETTSPTRQRGTCIHSPNGSFVVDES